MSKYKDPVEHKLIEKIEDNIKNKYSIFLLSLNKSLVKKITKF